MQISIKFHFCKALSPTGSRTHLAPAVELRLNYIMWLKDADVQYYVQIFSRLTNSTMTSFRYNEVEAETSRQEKRFTTQQEQVEPVGCAGLYS